MNRWLIMMLLCILPTTAWAWNDDIPGSKDHPLITRYPGSAIEWYEDQGYKPYSIAIGPVRGYRKIEDWKKVEGKVTRIYYVLRESPRSLFEVYTNYLNAVKKAGFDVLTEGFPKESVSSAVGGRTWLGIYYGQNAYPTESGIKLTHGSATSGGSGFFAAHLKKENREAYVAFAVAQYSATEIVALLDIVETAQMDDDLISVNADAMLASIQAEGKVALYGIYFDTGKALIKEESKPALEEIAKLLKSQSALRLYVVGHTDFTGNLAGNIELSNMRAAAVTDVLVKEHGIASDRLVPQGIGSLCPVASNQSPEGRTKNRRVELVEMPGQ